MLYATTTLLTELSEKVSLSLFMMASLLEMTTLHKDHIELNNRTVNWLQKIKPIFEQNSSKFEQKKFELEEQLQSRIITLNTQIDAMFPKLVLMDDMDDGNRIHEYIEDMRKLIRGLDRMDEQVEWINREEELFQYPRSVYPKIKELKEIILPYHALIYRAYQWKRDVGVWLDGPFEYLDANDIEYKTTEYFTDFSKIMKTYKTKIKMHIAMGYPYRYFFLE